VIARNTLSIVRTGPSRGSVFVLVSATLRLSAGAGGQRHSPVVARPA
jgi:hypothetical protein